jgi:hypothetical protein
MMEFVTQLLPMVGVVVGLFALALGAMAIGQRFTGRCLRGSCGGPKAVGPDGKPITCVGCPNADKHTQH